MARQTGTLKITSNIEPLVGAPLDARSVVKLKTDLTAAATFAYTYVGMQVAVQEEGKLYMLRIKPHTTLENWIEIGSGGGDMSNYYTKSEIDAMLSSVYTPVGTCTFAELPATLTASLLGNVYDVSDGFTTDSRFAEGAGHTYPAGTNVAVVNTGDAQTPIYKFDPLPGWMDLSGYQLKFQVNTLPEASATELGRIYQYTGTTTGTLVNGYFYKCISDGAASPTYSWVQSNTQEEGGAGELESAITTTKDVGGIAAGTTFPVGTSYDELWADLLAPVLYPTLTAPSAVLSATGDKLLEKGASLLTTMTVEFDRGSISPAYGTSGYRSGAAGSYSLNSGTAQVSNTFAVTVTEATTSYQASVNYGAGEQPKDSSGADYSTALDAGSVASNIINYEFVNALWANTASISAIQKLNLVSADAKVKVFAFPSATVSNPEVFDIPATWTVVGVEVLNTLSNQWEDCSSEFTITDTTHADASESSVNYKRYTCNLGYDMGARQIRVRWS